jgi:hypothetical protein
MTAGSSNRFAEVPAIINERVHPEKHADADCRFVFEEKWLQEENRSVFFYGIAHILKHRSRKQAYEILSSTRRLDADEAKCALQRTVGWADEFFWLSQWSRTKLLSGVRQNLRNMDDPFDLFLEALVTAEWADLIREAIFFYRNNLLPGRSSDESDMFEIWRPEPDSQLDKDLEIRAVKRFDRVRAVLRHLRMYHKSELEAQNTLLARGIEHVDWIYNLGMAWIERDNSVSYTRDAQKYAPSDQDKRWVKGLLQRIETGEDLGPERLTDRENRSDLAPIHILAEWIEDLLQDETRGPVHPRLSLPKPSPDGKMKISIFPNLDTIKLLVRSLSEHRDWLRFVNGVGGDYLKVIHRIEKADADLKAAVFASEPIPACPDDCWQLHMLRDWGSYTPLLPPGLKAGGTGRRSGGGGYFLRCGPSGIVIDPGYDYIEHFYEAGLRPSMITDVIVTHDHYDHAASFGPLLNLLFKDCKDGGRDRRRIDFLLSRGVYDQFARYIVDFRYYHNVEPLTDLDHGLGHQHLLASKPVRITVHTTHTEHGDSDGFGAGVGLIFSFSEQLPTLGITSDSGWYNSYRCKADLSHDESLGQVFERHSPQVMVLHVGSLKRGELRDSSFYRTHLGARGVLLSISAISSCRLALLSEFGEECRGYRQWFANALNGHFETERPELRCFPSDRTTCITGCSTGELLIGQHSDSKGIPYQEAAMEENDDGALRLVKKTT